MPTSDAPPPEQLQALCRRWKIRELSLFGSQARDDAGPDSDVDLLVEYEPAADWSLLDTARLRAELAELFGRPVDLVRERNVTNPYRLASIRRDRRRSMPPDEEDAHRLSTCWALPAKSWHSAGDVAARTSTVTWRSCALLKGRWNSSENARGESQRVPDKPMRRSRGGTSSECAISSPTSMAESISMNFGRLPSATRRISCPLWKR